MDTPPTTDAGAPPTTDAARRAAYAPGAVARRRMGAYYTPRSVAEYMADWAVRHDNEHVLEPSFGDGTFLHALAGSAARRGLRHLRVSAVELDPEALQHVARDEHRGALDLRRDDFLGVAPFPVGAVLGNPPYVRLRHLDEAARRRALRAAEPVLGRPMDPSGSLWMPFILHSMRFLREGGRLALVLPYELTYVRYARPLWKALGASFGSITVLRSHERLFPELLQDVVVLLADGFGGSCETVDHRVFERVGDLLAERPAAREALAMDDVVEGRRVFVRALLRPELRRLLDTRVAERTVPARERVTFNIGYVTGDKDFFHPGEEDVAAYGIPEASLHPALTSARTMRRGGVWSSALPREGRARLFLPDPARLTEGERRYLEKGEAAGVPRRYKCRIRNPWFVVPGTRVPDLLLSVFAERPKLMVNDAGLYASNSLLCGYCDGASPEGIAAAWYTSLTLLMCELEVHALGGGVMVMVPGEAGSVRIPPLAEPPPGHLAGLDARLRADDPEGAYLHGDRPVLVDGMGLTGEEVELVREGVAVLAHWRTAGRTPYPREAEP